MSSATNQAGGHIVVKAEREVAYNSPDHLMPWGTRSDNSRNLRFNQKLYHLFPKQENPIAVLDIGCSGGGFVKSCLDDGCLAVGLEGSDFSKKRRRAEWATIPDFLFTCDVTRDFEIMLDDGNPRALRAERSSYDGKSQKRIQFDIVTAWEVMSTSRPKICEDLQKTLKSTLSPLVCGL